jgi:hypothetical protein
MCFYIWSGFTNQGFLSNSTILTHLLKIRNLIGKYNRNEWLFQIR